MIVLLTKRTNTHGPLEKSDRFDFRVRTYTSVFRSFGLRRATYVFADLDRLDFWELELAGRLYHLLSRGGARVLNDPARVRQRFSLLRTLKEQTLNRFDVWRVEDVRRPDRFPVFLRRESAHQGPISDLLYDETQVREAVDEAVARGVPRRGLLLVEYRAEPVKEGLFRKLGMYRVGDRLVPGLCVHDSSWSAKAGKRGIAGRTLYEDELEIIANNRHEDDLWPAFRAAEIEYGRADFGLVKDRAEVYEINTNPVVPRPVGSHPFPVRVEAMKLAFRRLVEAFEAVDTLSGPRIMLDDRYLRRQRRLDRWMSGLRFP